MSFSDCLKGYINELEITATELAAEAGFSPSTISRYLNQGQIPTDVNIKKLAAAISKLSKEPEEKIFQVLQSASSKGSVTAESADDMLSNLKYLLSSMEITNTELAHALYVDPSYISRILSGERRPADFAGFMADSASYLSKRFHDTPTETSLLDIMEESEHPKSADDLSSFILNYLGHPVHPRTSQVSHFLDTLNEFDLEEFMASIHYDDMKVPTVPFQLPGSKTYEGLSEIMQAELDFLKYAVLSKSKADIILYSDMPIDEMSKYEDFRKKWMYGLALLLRKGHQLKMIHDVHRPMSEMLLGLEGWIPMYMTGQLSPYYLKEPTNHVFLHFIRSAGSVAISGEAIFGKQARGRYYVTRNKDDVAYYRRRAEDLLSRALPLMQIYREEEADKLAKELARHNKHDSELTRTSFKDIDVTISQGEYVLVSKSKSPAIHFLIFHPKMIEAFEQFVTSNPE